MRIFFKLIVNFVIFLKTQNSFEKFKIFLQKIYFKKKSFSKNIFIKFIMQLFQTIKKASNDELDLENKKPLLRETGAPLVGDVDIEYDFYKIPPGKK